MELVAITTALALLQYLYLGFQVGQARGRYNVEAPATTGHPIFERHLRVHYNTLEQLVAFVPGQWLTATYVSTSLAALLGIAFIAGRFVYARGYVADPTKRGPGFVLTAGATMVGLLVGLVGALVQLVR